MTHLTNLQKARARLLLRTPFYGALLMTTPLIADSSVPTACTDMVSIRYNPEWFESLSVEAAMFVLTHEVMHIIFRHGLRRSARDAMLWNIAADYAINWVLTSNGQVMPTDDEGNPVGMLDPKYAGKSAEVIYDLLKQDPPPPEAMGAIGQDLRDPPPGIDVKALEDRIPGKVAMAAAAAQAAGQDLPDALKSLVQGLLSPQVPWQDVLRNFMRQQARTRADWTRRNKRFPSVILPSKAGKRMGKIGVIFDTSASLNHQIMRDTLASEIVAINDEVGAEEIHVRYVDSRVRGEQRFRQGETLLPASFEPIGGGGTDMRVGIQAFEDDDEPCMCVIMLTDGETPWPASEPTIPLIVCCTTQQPIPVGMEVRINVGQQTLLEANPGAGRWTACGWASYAHAHHPRPTEDAYPRLPQRGRPGGADATSRGARVSPHHA